MSELGESRWAVMSERGCEASGLVYAEARELMLRLKREKVHGLCVITDRAARYIAHENAAERNLAPKITARG